MDCDACQHEVAESLALALGMQGLPVASSVTVGRSASCPMEILKRSNEVMHVKQSARRLAQRTCPIIIII